MPHQIRNVPELNKALRQAALEHLYLRGPDSEEGAPTRWLPCECCDAVVTVPQNVVATICPDCASPCVDPECGLLVHEHVDGCEPIATEDKQLFPYALPTQIVEGK